jgi:hypothetical protein
MRFPTDTTVRSPRIWLIALLVFIAVAVVVPAAQAA